MDKTEVNELLYGLVYGDNRRCGETIFPNGARVLGVLNFGRIRGVKEISQNGYVHLSVWQVQSEQFSDLQRLVNWLEEHSYEYGHVHEIECIMNGEHRFCFHPDDFAILKMYYSNGTPYAGMNLDEFFQKVKVNNG